MEVLNSKASKDELCELAAQKTNKQDTEMQLKSIDILHKQLIMLGTLLLEVIKAGIDSKKET